MRMTIYIKNNICNNINTLLYNIHNKILLKQIEFNRTRFILILTRASNIKIFLFYRAAKHRRTRKKNALNQ